MLEKMKKRMKNERGFTLVELLAVIVILGIILAIAIPSIGNVISKSQKDAHLANVALIENAARLADVSGDFEDDKMSVDDLVTRGYLAEAPTIPGKKPASDSGKTHLYQADVKKITETNSNKVTFEYQGKEMGE